MKTEKLAHWAEIISSLVVVITLIFLIHEVQRNTTALERQSEMDRNASLTTPFFEAPELSSVMAKIKAVDGPDPLPQALMERYGLTYEEADLWGRLMYGMWFGVEADFDALGPEEVEDMLRTLFSTADNRLFWETLRDHFSNSQFVSFVDSIAAETQTDS
jgi:hypothetical protein